MLLSRVLQTTYLRTKNNQSYKSHCPFRAVAFFLLVGVYLLYTIVLASIHGMHDCTLTNRCSFLFVHHWHTLWLSLTMKPYSTKFLFVCISLLTYQISTAKSPIVDVQISNTLKDLYVVDHSPIVFKIIRADSSKEFSQYGYEGTYR